MTALCCFASCDLRAEPRPLLLVGQDRVEAALVRSTAEGMLHFQLKDGQQQVPLEQLVRWSAPRVRGGKRKVILVDGSHLVLADSWIGEPAVRLEAEAVRVTTNLLGTVALSRDQVRAVLLHAPADVLQRTQALDEILAPQASDRMMMVSGDIHTGRCQDIGSTIQFATSPSTKPLELPFNGSVAAIAIGRPGGQPPPPPGKMVVGLRDGTLLVAESLVASAESLQLRLACGLELSGAGVRIVDSVRSQVAKVRYLSDQVETAYRHVAYLEIPWPARRDLNVLGGPLTAGDRTYSKGLGMHTASRLTYDLPIPLQNAPPEFLRFRAQIALDDAAAKGGSVEFRVYLQDAGTWQLAYSSAVVRGGEAPQAVSVELGGAQQIAMVADYADQGDERDYANWLDARLE